LKPFTANEWALAARSIPDGGPVTDFKPVTQAVRELVAEYMPDLYASRGHLHGWKRSFLFQLLVRGHVLDPSDAVSVVVTDVLAHHEKVGLRHKDFERAPDHTDAESNVWHQGKIIGIKETLEPLPREAVNEEEAAMLALSAMKGGYIAIGSLVEEDEPEADDPLAALVAELAGSNPDGFTSDAVYSAAAIRGIPLEPGRPKTARRVMTHARACGLTKREVQRNGERVRLFTKSVVAS
jgi:hypothetical protein